MPELIWKHFSIRCAVSLFSELLANSVGPRAIRNVAIVPTQRYIATLRKIHFRVYVEKYSCIKSNDALIQTGVYSFYSPIAFSLPQSARERLFLTRHMTLLTNKYPEVSLCQVSFKPGFPCRMHFLYSGYLKNFNIIMGTIGSFEFGTHLSYMLRWYTGPGCSSTWES